MNFARTGLGRVFYLAIAHAFPAQSSRFGWGPIAGFVTINTENILNAAPCEFRHGDLFLLAQRTGSRVNLVRELDLSSCHAIGLTAVIYDVNLTAYCSMGQSYSRKAAKGSNLKNLGLGAALREFFVDGFQRCSRHHLEVGPRVLIMVGSARIQSVVIKTESITMSLPGSVFVCFLQLGNV